MKATTKRKKVVKQTGKSAKRAAKKVTRKASGPAKKSAKMTGKVQKLGTPKDALIRKLKEALAAKESRIRKSAATLKEAIDQAGTEISEFKDRTSRSLLALKEKAEVESKKLREEMETRTQTLRNKVAELEEYKKTAESRMAELQARAKEFAGKGGLPTEKERSGLITFKGNPLTLLGQEVKVGDRAPNFQVVDKAMQRANLESFKGKVKVITAVPSLDTPVCDAETHRFNEEAGKLPEKAIILTISMDLPFAQARWCAAAGVEKVQTFSDYRDRSFGLAYGVLIKELKLLARSVFIVDEQDVIRYVELVPEVTQQPDYERVMSAVRALL